MFVLASAAEWLAAAPAAALVAGDLHRPPRDGVATTCRVFEVAPDDHSRAVPVPSAAPSSGQLELAVSGWPAAPWRPEADSVALTDPSARLLEIRLTRPLSYPSAAPCG